MLVVHGLWRSDSQLCLWGEDSTLPATPPRRSGRPPRQQPHPYAVPHDILAAALGEWGAKATTSTTELLLPTRGGGPLESPELVRPVSAPESLPASPDSLPASPGSLPDEGPAEASGQVRGPVSLRRWLIPILEYDQDDALTVLRGLDPELVTLGASLRQLQAVADFAIDLVTRGRLLPSVRLPSVPSAQAPSVRLTRAADAGDGPSAVWRPVLTGPDIGWARSLALALPPSARAFPIPSRDLAVVHPGITPMSPISGGTTARSREGEGGAEGKGEGGESAGEIVARALDALVDSAARAALDGYQAGQPGLAKSRRGGKRATAGKATDSKAGLAGNVEAAASSKAGLAGNVEAAASSKAGLAGSVEAAAASKAGWAGSVEAAASSKAGLAGSVEAAAGAWRAALTGRQRHFAATAEAATALAAELDTWQRDALGAAVRACFRLVEPVGGPDTTVGEPDNEAEDGWRLEFSLQSADEPSLMVDAEQVWRSRGALRAIARQLDSPQETLLAELGRANRLYPSLAQALRTAKPARLELDANGAHEFLREGAPLLAGAGFGVLLPSWWSKPGAKLGVRLNASSRTAPGTVGGTSTLGMHSIVDYKWELALGDEPLSADELTALTALKAPLIRLRGQWVELDPRRLAAGLKLMARDGTETMTVGELLQIGASTTDGPGGLPVASVAAEGWLGELLSGEAERRLVPVAAPEGFHGTLRPYQERGLAWLTFLQSLGLGGVLADDMGLGKTVQLLALLAGDPPDTGPSLLVCPMSLVGNWQREAGRFAPALRVHVHHGAERPRGKEFTAAVGEADLVVTTYAIAARDADALAKIKWHRLVLDEAQAIKNAATRQAAAVRALPARHRIAVTGTPVENRLADLWSILEFANPGLLGTAPNFKQRFAEPIERHGNEEAAGRLRRLTGPFILRRVKTDKSIISDLPEKLEMEVLCNLTAEQGSLYQAVVCDMLARIEQSDGVQRRGLVLATMSKLKQVCNHPAQLLHDGSRLAGRSGKLARLEEILDEVMAAGEKALMFTQYAEFGGMLRAHLSARLGREVLFLHGGIGKAGRDDMVKRFQGRLADPGQSSSSQGEGGPALFVLSLKAGGTGLTLTAANHVVHVDRWWNPAVEDQATDRAFRIGQKRAVQVRKFVCAGTVEEKISTMIRDKRGLAAKIVGTGEQWLTELSTGELRELFTLDAGAVVE